MYSSSWIVPMLFAHSGFHAGPSLPGTVTYQLGIQPLLDRSPHDGDGRAHIMTIFNFPSLKTQFTL